MTAKSRLAFLLSVALSHPTLCSAGIYSITDLGVLSGDVSSRARDINSSGQVVGVSFKGGNEASHAFRYSGGVMSDLGHLLGKVNIFSNRM